MKTNGVICADCRNYDKPWSPPGSSFGCLAKVEELRRFSRVDGQYYVRGNCYKLNFNGQCKHFKLSIWAWIRSWFGR